MIVAFDCDGTLINDKDEPNHRLIDLLRWFSENGDRIYVWSGGGVEYAQRWIDRFALPALAIEKGSQQVDLAVDDEIVELGTINLKVRRFQPSR